MTERQPTHLLGVRIERWDANDYTPGPITPKEKSWEHYRGTIADCDVIAAGHGAPDLSWETPATEDRPVHDRTYHRISAEGEATEVWCRSHELDVLGRSEWVERLPTVADVFDAKKHERRP